MRVDQLLPAFHRGDAIGDTARHMRDLLRARGHESEIYALDRDRDLEGESRLFADYPAPGPGDVAVLHFALASPLGAAFAGLRARKVLIHHNVTPPEFFAPYSAELARICRLGREELASLAGAADLALADSEFNRRELEALGFPRTAVQPLVVDFRRYETPPSGFVRSLYEDGRANLLFVGRVAPNKKIEDLVRTAFYYKKYVSPLVRLVVVGKTGALPRYTESLVRLADEFHLQAEEIVFAGHLPDAEMFALYRTARVFLSASEHEGFCLPLLESMVFDLPVAAYAAGAVPDTLDGAGVLVRDKRPDRLGELAAALAQDGPLRERVLAGQRERLRRYRALDPGRLFLERIEEVAG